MNIEDIKFKPLKKDITYVDICNNLFKTGYFINNRGKISRCFDYIDEVKIDKNNATNKKQLERLLALNQLLNIAEYYNTLHPICTNHVTIEYDGVNNIYYPSNVSTKYKRGIKAIFNNQEDTQAVINNSNFKEILDTIYKD